MYISFHKVQHPGMVCVLIHLMSRLTEEFPQLLQKYLNERLDPVSELYDPAFPWDSARLILMYHGPQELPDRGRITLPNGRTVQMFNINPGHSGLAASLLGDYIPARLGMEEGELPVYMAVTDDSYKGFLLFFFMPK